MLKIAVIVYHKNVYQIYKPEWVELFKETLLNQTNKNFKIFELNYGGGVERIFDNSFYESATMPNFVYAMNYLLDKCFSGGFDYVFNLNSDDFYSLNRIEKQLEYAEKGIDIISSNFSLIQDDELIHTHRFDKLDIKTELDRKNNPLCHPVIAYSKKFWQQNRYNPDEIPFEDMLLWKRAIEKGNSFIILPEVLCYHRVHDNSVCNSENR